MVAEAVSGSQAGLRFAVELAAADGRGLARVERRLAGPGEGTIAALSIAFGDPASEEMLLFLSITATGEGPPGTGRWLDPCLTARRRRPSPSPPRLSTSAPPRASLGADPGPRPELDGSPRLSFLVPVHDPKPVFLDRALSSVIRQTDPRWELCVFDDASTDPAVRELLTAHTEADSRVRLERSESALGISGATNRALAMARGEFVALLDHDDEVAPDALAAFARASSSFPTPTSSTRTRRRSTRPIAGRGTS